MATVLHELGLEDGPEERKPTADTIGPADYPEGDDEEEHAYATYSRAMWDEQEAALEPLHSMWIETILFLAGLHYHERNHMRGTFEPKHTASWRAKTVANLILPFFRHQMAKLTKSRPATTAIAASTDPEDIESAKLGDDALEGKWVELRLSRTLRRMIAWLLPTGNAFLLPYWNEQTGKLRPLTVPVEAMVYDEAGNPVGMEEVECPADENGEPKMTDGPFGPVYDLDAEPHYIDEGDVAVKVISPFQVRVDPWAECDDDLTFMLIGEPLPIREIARRKGHEFARKVSSEDLGVMEQYDQMVAGMFSPGEGMSASASAGVDRDEAIPKALVLHYYEKPSEKYPEGRYWQTAGGALIEEPQPLPDGLWPPLVHMVDVEVPGRYHGYATMHAIVGLNREYNSINNQIKEHHELLLRGKWLVPKGSGITKGSISAMPGEVIQHTPGLAPKQADIKPLPAAIYQERERVKADIQLISGLNKISMGQAPPGVTAGRAFLVLQEADDTDLGPLLHALEDAVADLGWKILQLMQKNYTDERLIHIVGADRSYAVRSFTGADLQGVVDVQAQVGSSSPWNQMARQSALIDLISAMPDLVRDDETGMLDRHKIARLLPVGGLESLDDMQDIDLNEAKREEDEFREMNSTPLVQPFQNHAMHDRQHTRTLKTAAFQQWPQEAKDAFFQHWMETRNAIMMERQQMALEAMAAQGGMVGGAPQGGGSSAPSSPEAAADARAAEIAEGGSVNTSSGGIPG
jgi:hypothetical protein